MPSLRQLDCQIEWAGTGTAFEEYGTAYGDCVVETYIVIPSSPQTFSIRITSKGYISEGLAVLVFMDGDYQCNRNRLGLKPRKKGQARNETEIDFRLRQKEKPVGDGSFIGREWRFDTHNPLEGVPQDADPGHFDSLGTIEIFVLRCRAAVSDDARSTSSSGVDIDPLGKQPMGDDDASEFEDADEDEGIAVLANHAAPTVEEEPDGLMNGLFDGANDRGDLPNFGGGVPTNGYWAYHPNQPGHRMHSGGQPWGPQPGYNAGPPSNSFPEQTPPHPTPPSGPGKHVHFDVGGPPNTRAVPLQPPQQWQYVPPPHQPGPLPPALDPSAHGTGQQGGYQMPTYPIPFDAVPPFIPPQAVPPQALSGYAAPAGWFGAGYMPYPKYPSYGYESAQGYGGGPGYDQYPHSYYSQRQGYDQGKAMPANSPAGPQNWTSNAGKGSVDPVKDENNQGQGWSNDNNAGSGDYWSKVNANTGNNSRGSDGWGNNNGDNANHSGGDDWGNNNVRNGTLNNGNNNGRDDEKKDEDANNNGGDGATGWGEPFTAGSADAGKDSWGNDASNDNNQVDQSWNDHSSDNQGNQNWNDHSNNKQADQSWNADDTSNQNQNQTQNNTGSDWGPNAQSTTQPQNTWSPADATPSTSQMPGAFPFTQPRSLYGPHGPYYTLQPSTTSAAPEAEEEPRYDVPLSYINATGSTHQVQPGRGYLYLHRRHTPQYVDDFETPYARFVFQYRTKEQLARELGVQIDVEPSADHEVQALAGMGKDAIIKMLLRAKNALGGRIPEDPGEKAKALNRGTAPAAVPVPKKRVGGYRIPVRQAGSQLQNAGLGLKEFEKRIPGWKGTPEGEKGWGNGNANANAVGGGGDGWAAAPQNQHRNQNSVGNDWAAGGFGDAGARPTSPPENGSGGGGNNGWGNASGGGGGGGAGAAATTSAW